MHCIGGGLWSLSEELLAPLDCSNVEVHMVVVVAIESSSLGDGMSVFWLQMKVTSLHKF